MVYIILIFIPRKLEYCTDLFPMKWLTYIYFILIALTTNMDDLHLDQISMYVISTFWVT